MLIFIVVFIALSLGVLSIIFGRNYLGEETSETIFMWCFFVAISFPVYIVLTKRKELINYDSLYKNNVIERLIKSFFAFVRIFT